MQHCTFPRLSLSIFALCCGGIFATSTIVAEPAVPGPEKSEMLPLRPAELVHIGKFTITNSMLVTWAVAAGIIIFAQLAMRNIKPVPSGAQNFWEWLVQCLYVFPEYIIGRLMYHKTLWYFAKIFVLI